MTTLNSKQYFDWFYESLFLKEGGSDIFNVSDLFAVLHSPKVLQLPFKQQQQHQKGVSMKSIINTLRKKGSIYLKATLLNTLEEVNNHRSYANSSSKQVKKNFMSSLQ